MKRKVQAQRKFAQGAYIPPNTGGAPSSSTSTSTSTSAGVDRRTDQAPQREAVTCNKIPATDLLNYVCFNKLHKHSRPVVALERLRTLPGIQQDCLPDAATWNQPTPEVQENISPSSSTQIPTKTPYVLRSRPTKPTVRQITNAEEHMHINRGDTEAQYDLRPRATRATLAQITNAEENKNTRDTEPNSNLPIQRPHFCTEDDQPLAFFTKRKNLRSNTKIHERRKTDKKGNAAKKETNPKGDAAVVGPVQRPADKRKATQKIPDVPKRTKPITRASSSTAAQNGNVAKAKKGPVAKKTLQQTPETPKRPVRRPSRATAAKQQPTQSKKPLSISARTRPSSRATSPPRTRSRLGYLSAARSRSPSGSMSISPPRTRSRMAFSSAARSRSSSSSLSISPPRTRSRMALSSAARSRSSSSSLSISPPRTRSRMAFSSDRRQSSSMTRSPPQTPRTRVISPGPRNKKSHANPLRGSLKKTKTQAGPRNKKCNANPLRGILKKTKTAEPSTNDANTRKSTQRPASAQNESPPNETPVETEEEQPGEYQVLLGYSEDGDIGILGIRPRHGPEDEEILPSGSRLITQSPDPGQNEEAYESRLRVSPEPTQNEEAEESRFMVSPELTQDDDSEDIRLKMSPDPSEIEETIREQNNDTCNASAFVDLEMSIGDENSSSHLTRELEEVKCGTIMTPSLLEQLEDDDSEDIRLKMSPDPSGEDFIDDYLTSSQAEALEILQNAAVLDQINDEKANDTSNASGATAGLLGDECPWSLVTEAPPEGEDFIAVNYPSTSETLEELKIASTLDGVPVSAVRSVSPDSSIEEIKPPEDDVIYVAGPSTLPASASDDLRNQSSNRRASLRSRGSHPPGPSAQRDEEAPRPGPRIVDAPVFFPTEEEFMDPMKYMKQIMHEASEFGICKIVPPKKFVPKYTLNKDMRFKVTNQYICRLYERWGPASQKLTAIKAYLATQGVPFLRPPLLESMEVDLTKLYQVVQNLGGLKSVMENKRWNTVAEDMHLTRTSKADEKIDFVYVKYLLPYDTLTHSERVELMKVLDVAWDRQSQRMVRRARNPLHRMKTLLYESESSEDEEPPTKTHRHIAKALSGLEDCFVNGRNMTLATFKKVAQRVMDTQFEGQRRPDVERRYWDLVLGQDQHLCVYSAAVATGEKGYGFPNDPEDPFANHPWNLKVLSENKENILRYLGPVQGVTVPTLHLGMAFSTSCWHRDPHGLPWIEFLHSGPPKIWYGIPESESANFRKAAEHLCPTLCQKKKIWLPSDMAMIPPQRLVQEGVTLSRIEQRAGEFVLVFPKAYSCSVCTGYTESESVYFATEEWLPSVPEVFREVRESCEPTMFSLEKLVLAAAQDEALPFAQLRHIHVLLKDMVREAITNRATFNKFHIKFPEDEKTSKGRSLPLQNNRELDECEVCRTTLFLSRVRGLTEDSVCQEHALMMMRALKRRHFTPLSVKVEVFIKENDLFELLEKVEDRLAVHRSSSEGTSA